MRIHQKDVQRKMFEALGFSEEQIQERFGFMVNAFQYGTPPHGGFAFGLDRLAMQMLEAESLRDVIAFPKNKDAVCPMTQAPNVVDPHQLEVLGLAALLSKEGTGKAVQKRQRPKIDVENVANLSKLLLSPEEKEAAAKDMEEIVEFANQKQEAGIDKLHAIEEASLQRLRPILMTSASTILGLLPLTVATGEGANGRIAMGIAVVGGMIVSTFLTLFIVPAMYSFISTDRRKKLKVESRE